MSTTTTTTATAFRSTLVDLGYKPQSWISPRGDECLSVYLDRYEDALEVARAAARLGRAPHILPLVGGALAFWPGIPYRDEAPEAAAEADEAEDA